MTGAGGWADRLSRPRTVLLLILAYCAVHWAVRMAVSPVYTLDEAEQVLFSQSLQWGYRFRHPPLVTWIYALMEEAIGLHRWSFHAVKYVAMAAGFAGFYLAARRLLREPAAAALATLAWGATWALGLAPHLDLTHTVLLTALLFFNLHAFALAMQRGRWGDWAYLGVTIGLGTLSKYVFVIQPAALLLALALTPALRARIAPGRLAAALAIGIAIVAPYALWSATEGYSLAELGQEASRGSGATANPLMWIAGIGGLVLAMLEFSLPLLALFALLFPRAVFDWRRRPDAEPETAAWARLLSLSMLIGAAMFSVAVFAFGATEFKSRWMHEILAPLPIVLFLRAQLTGADGTRRLAVFAAACAVFILSAVAGRFAFDAWKPQACAPTCREFQPVEAWADDLRAAGFTGGTIVAMDHHLGGNLRALMPEARVLAAFYPVAAFPAPEPDGPGQCLLVWTDAVPHSQARALNYAFAWLGVQRPEQPDGEFRHPIRGNPDYEMPLWYAFVEPTPDCR